jgi:hypothetical protein
MNLIALLLSSILDTPFMPFLGLPLFVVAFPRQKRLWPRTQRVATSQGESLLYSKFLENFAFTLKEHALAHTFYFRCGRIFLVRLEKYLATV